MWEALEVLPVYLEEWMGCIQVVCFEMLPHGCSDGLGTSSCVERMVE